MAGRAVRALFIGAHPDDIELGCGATIARYSEAAEIFCLVLSNDDESPGGHAALAEQSVESLTMLGVDPRRIMQGGFRTRHFFQDRQLIADDLHRINTEFAPDLIFSHSGGDMHQDHVVAHAEARRIFRKNILEFEILRSSLIFDPSIFIPVTEAQMDRKIDSLAPYEVLRQRKFLSATAQRSHLRTRGLACDLNYAEAFQAFRLIMNELIGDLLFIPD